jgi:hypothetical protein
MSDQSNMAAERGFFLGEQHPHKNLQHAQSEKVGGKNCTEWMIEWTKWLLEIPYDKSPMVYKEVNPFDKGYKSLRPFKEEVRDEGVMFLAAPAYGSSSSAYSSTYEIVPLGKWHLFFAPYMVFNSSLEYPSLNEDELSSLSKTQVDAVYKLEVLVDGLSVECSRVSITSKDNAIVQIHDENVLGIESDELKDGNDSLKIIGEGYGVFLKPLDPGLHLLTFRGYSRFYTLDTQIQLNVRGPKTKPLSTG